MKINSSITFCLIYTNARRWRVNDSSGVGEVPVPVVLSLGFRTTGGQVRVALDPVLFSFPDLQEIDTFVALIQMILECDVGSWLAVGDIKGKEAKKEM